MSEKQIDPTLGGLLISAIAALILRIRVKVKKKTPEKDVNVSVEFDKQFKNDENEKI